MAPRRRRQASSTVNGHRPNCIEQPSSGRSAVRSHRARAITNSLGRRRLKRRVEHERAMSNSRPKRNLEDSVSGDPKLNGRLVPTVSLENSAHSPSSRRRRQSVGRKSMPPPKFGGVGLNRALRARNPVPDTFKGSNRHESLKMFKLSQKELCRVKSRESLSCLNILAPVFADCKLNGAVAPRVVLKRLDIDTILQNGLAPLGPRKTTCNQNLTPNRDLKCRMKSRVKIKGLETARNLKAPKVPGISRTVRTRTSHSSKKREQKFEPVPFDEKKWWNSFPLKQVAVRLTKLPL